LLTPDLRARVLPYIGGIIRDLNGAAILINGVEDHIHILSTFPSTIALSDFMRQVKASSSAWVNENHRPPQPFGWQIGYAAFSVSQSNVGDVRAYIAKQEEHHRHVTFEQEYLAFLRRHGIQYDPRFVFDQEFAG
jgi:REP element-mobilizing transposase RayT